MNIMMLQLKFDDIKAPATALPVTIGNTHHDEEEDEREEDEAGEHIDDGRGGGDGDRRLCHCCRTYQTMVVVLSVLCTSIPTKLRFALLFLMCLVTI